VIEMTVEGSYNARVIGAPGRPWLVRSAALDDLTEQGEATLRAHGVDLIIDLREPTEHRPSSHNIEIHSVPLYREQPPATGTLEGIYLRLLAERGQELSSAVSAIANHPGLAVVHCTAGKDRTGLVIALARLAAGDARNEVVSDYSHSGATVRPARIGIATAQLQALSLSEDDHAAAERLHLDSPAEAIEVAIDYIEQQGGAPAYLLRHGVAPEHIETLRHRAANTTALPTTTSASTGEVVSR
jgi:protein tyrosine/serine phosphatase